MGGRGRVVSAPGSGQRTADCGGTGGSGNHGRGGMCMYSSAAQPQVGTNTVSTGARPTRRVLLRNTGGASDLIQRQVRAGQKHHVAATQPHRAMGVVGDGIAA